MSDHPIKFSQPDIDDKALEYVRRSLGSGELSGDGPFSKKCADWLFGVLGKQALLTHSATAALDMAAILADVGPGDEVIMPSFTFSSTANAVVLRGAMPVFVDIRPDTLNLDEALLEGARSERTKAVIPVHYAGVACEMDAIDSFARAHNLMVIEDAAQAYLASYRDRPLGTLGALSCLSFHVTKNVVSGEGGALLVNDSRLLERAHIIREKGTNRRQFINKEVQKYEWLDLGSSYLLSDVLAALLLSQLEKSAEITARRLEIWQRYHMALADAERKGLLRRPAPPPYAKHNAHIYWVEMASADIASKVRERMAQAKIPCPHHYIPLHSAPAGRKFGRTGSAMTVTDRVTFAMARLPLHSRMTNDDVDRTVDALLGTLRSI